MLDDPNIVVNEKKKADETWWKLKYKDDDEDEAEYCINCPYTEDEGICIQVEDEEKKYVMTTKIVCILYFGCCCNLSRCCISTFIFI
jgi:hypothetical protein